MRYKIARGLAVAICLLIVVWECFAPDPIPDAPYPTPEDCFQAAQSAIAARDYAEYCRCLTPETQVGMSAGMIRTAVRAKGKLEAVIAAEGDLPGLEVVKNMVQTMYDAMDRQGIDQTKLPRPLEVEKANSPQEPMDISFIQAAAVVPDNPKLIAELVEAMGGTDKSFETRMLERFEGVIVNLIVEGDVASARFIRKQGLEGRKFMNFRRNNGNWLIHLGND